MDLLTADLSNAENHDGIQYGKEMPAIRQNIRFGDSSN